MDIVGGAYGAEDPRTEFATTLETAKSWLEGALSGWSGLTQQRQLEMVAASLLSMNQLQMKLEDMFAAAAEPAEPADDLKIEISAARPSLVDLAMERRERESVTRVELEFREQKLVGRSACQPGAGTDHAAFARATLNAVRRVTEEELRLEDARVLQILDGPFAVVTLRNRDRLLVGSAMIDEDLGRAIARATLDAANRFINGRTEQDEPAIQLN